MYSKNNILNLKKILYLISLFFLFSCSYFAEKNTQEKNLIKNNQEITVDNFLGINETTLLNNSGVYNKNTNTGIILPELINKDEKTEDIINIKKIEDIDLEINEIITEDSLEEVKILEEISEEDIDELINILFDTSD